MKKSIKGILSASLSKHLFYLFSAYCFVFGIAEYFFNDEIWGNQSILNLLLLVLIFLILQKTLPGAGKRTFLYGTVFSALLSASLVFGNCIYWGGQPSLLFASAKTTVTTLMTLFGFIVVILSAFIIILKLCNFFPAQGDGKVWKINRYPFVYGILMFLCWLPCYLTYYPGIFAYDIELQTMEALGDVAYSRFHPPLHTFLWDLCLSAEQGIGLNALVIYSLVQMCLFATAFTYVLYFMIKKNSSNLLILGSFVFFAFNPVIALFSFIPVKDAMLAVTFVVFCVELGFFADSPATYSKNIPANIKLVLFGLLCCLLRNNVVYALVPTFICIFFLMKKQWKRILLWLGCILLGYLLINGPFYSALGIEKGNSREMLSVPMQQIAYVVVCNEAALSTEEVAQINEYIPTENLSALYNPRFADPVKNTFITEAFNESPSDFIKLWWQLFLKYPEDYLVAFLNLHIPYWYPDANSVDMFSQRAYIETTVPDMPQTDYVVVRDSKLPALYAQYEKVASFERFKTLPVISNLFSISLPIWFVLLGISILGAKKERSRIVLFLPSLFLWCSFLLGPVSNLRYLLPIVVLYPLFTFFILKKNKE